MYLRMEDELEARRAFSEIVEFAPNDELARRLLGDLYRAHGWYEDAYRQYQTLASIRPDDPTVFLLLAQAAAGAGRIDEALRLEQRLAETAQPGEAFGPARTAILWSSVRLAELRKDARAHEDEERLHAYLGRMRRGGVLREAGALRASLTWSHPDANLSLWAAHPGLSLTRPTDIAPEFGIEAFDLAEQEPGVYHVEVRRREGDGLTGVTAKLTVVWREGRDDERIEVIPLRFDEAHRAYAWAIEGDTLRESAPSAAATEGGR
jgi:Ca-activated chloride channel family protein